MMGGARSTVEDRRGT